MIVDRIALQNLRNHVATEALFSPGLNILYGLNGAGKTSILEAISICGLSKSFMPAPDAALIRNEAEAYVASSQCRSDLGIPYKIAVRYAKGLKKQINSSIGDNLLPRDIIGEMPLVILSPDHKAITFGAPQDRRQFLDSVLSQSSKKYIDDALTLKRCLKQRNSLLALAKKDNYFDYSLIEPWTDMLIDAGARMVVRRKMFLDEFSSFFMEAYQNVTGGAENVGLVYEPDCISQELIRSNLSKDDVAGIYRDTVRRLKIAEIRRGTTLFGPQKDEIRILINSGVAKDFASQGQHKSLLISIKFAEFNYLNEIKQETPIILLDDIFSELDDMRTEKVLELVLHKSAQTMITLTNPDKMRKVIPESANCSYFQIHSGQVQKEA